MADVAAPYGRSVPMAGFTWVDQYLRTTDGVTVPGHWEHPKKGQTPQGRPLLASEAPGKTDTITVRDHTDTGATTIAQGQITAVADLLGPRRVITVTSDDQLLLKNALMAKGATLDEYNWVQDQRKKANDIDSQLSSASDGKVYGSYVSQAKANELKDSGSNPFDWYVGEWYKKIVAKRADDAKAASDKAAADAAKTATPPADTAKLPPLPGPTTTTTKPLPTTKPVSTTGTMNVAILAVGAGLAVYLLSR